MRALTLRADAIRAARRSATISARIPLSCCSIIVSLEPIWGQRVRESTPEGNWKILTILGAMSLDGMLATMTIEAATDAEIFLAYLDQVLCPQARRRGGDGQPQLPQGLRRRRAHQRSRSRSALSAALLARPQPHRESLGQAQ